jgi:phenylalanyl-tRNA synthetase beta chain
MRVPYGWLREYLEADIAAEDLAQALTMGGLEVEEVREWTSEDGQATDLVLCTKVTANRGDLLSMIGVARHAAAVLGTTWRLPEIPWALVADPVVGATQAADGRVTIELADISGCPRYSALLMEGLAMQPSPAWLAHRLEAAGMRPLSQVIDCTNYVMLELGQPLHAFDYDLLRAGHIIVRRATAGEQMQTLDRQERALTPEDLLITDPHGPIALAGVMGGSSTEVSPSTARVLMESAHFDPTTIRKTSLRLGLSSEASYRFERHVDPNGTLRAIARVTDLILATCGGQVVGQALDACAEDFAPRRLLLRPERCNAVLGTDLPATEMARCLRAIGCEVQEAPEGLQVAVPRLRWDIEREVDLIEEVIIVHGYEQLPLTVPGRLSQSGLLTRRQREVRRVGEILRECGLNETLSFSVGCPADLDRIALPADAPERTMLGLRNPMIDTQTHLRTTLIPALLEACETNVRQRVTDVALYEVNKVFQPVAGQALPEEPLRVAGVLMGSTATSDWQETSPSGKVGGPREPDFHHIKGIVEQLCDGLGVAGVSFVRPDHPHPTLHPGRCASLLIEGEPAGVLGEVASPVQQAYDLPAKVYLFELDLERLLAAACEHKPYRQLPRFPALLRDLAFVCADDEAHAAARLQELILAAGGETLREVQAFDLFVSPERLGAGMKNLAYRLTFRAADRTLTDAEVDELVERVKASVAARTEAKFRDY